MLAPTLELMGAQVSIEVVKPGYCPNVIGEVRTSIMALKSGEKLRAIQLLERGSPAFSV